MSRNILKNSPFTANPTPSSPPVVRYLKWLSINAKSFNVGQYRRCTNPQPSSDFFAAENTEGEKQRRAAAQEAVVDMLKWFEDGGHVGVLDATNSTKERRAWIKAQCEARNCEVLFVESLCSDDELIKKNIAEVKTSSPDYTGQDPNKAIADFQQRIKEYEKVYQSIEQSEDLTYVQLIDVGSQVIINQVSNYLQTRIIYFTMNLHITPRSIWLSRVGAPLTLCTSLSNVF